MGVGNSGLGWGLDAAPGNLEDGGEERIGRGEGVWSECMEDIANGVGSAFGD